MLETQVPEEMVEGLFAEKPFGCTLLDPVRVSYPPHVPITYEEPP